MSFLAKLYVDGYARIVNECSFSIDKDIDVTGKPASRAKAGQIHLLLQLKERDKVFMNWAESDTMMKNGSIVFYKDNAEAKMDELVFTKAYCVHFSPNFNSQHGFVASIVLSAYTLKFGDGSYTNFWGNMEKKDDKPKK